MTRIRWFAGVATVLASVVGSACARSHGSMQSAPEPAEVQGAGALAGGGTTTSRAGALGGDASGAGAAALASAGEPAGGASPAGGGSAASGGSGTDPGLPGVELLPEPPREIIVVGAARLPVGLWVGELRSQSAMVVGDYPDPALACGASSRRVNLQLYEADDQRPAQGVLVFGEDQIDGPQPIDPEAGYPPDSGLVCGVGSPAAGYPYALREGHVTEEGFDFRVSVVELWDPWCMNQPSVAQRFASDTGYLCLPSMDQQTYQSCRDVDNPDRSADRCPASANVFRLCDDYAACYCLADGCRARMTRTLRFALVVAGDEMSGVVTSSVAELPALELRLRRVP